MELRQHYDEIEALGVQLIAINPDIPHITAEHVEKFRLPFTVLSDTKMEAAQAFGIAWHVTDRDDEYYQKLERHSGETHHYLPVPAYYVVNTDGVIEFAYVNPNYRARPPYTLMIAAVEAAIQMAEQD